MYCIDVYWRNIPSYLPDRAVVGKLGNWAHKWKHKLCFAYASFEGKRKHKYMGILRVTVDDKACDDLCNQPSDRLFM